MIWNGRAKLQTYTHIHSHTLTYTHTLSLSLSLLLSLSLSCGTYLGSEVEHSGASRLMRWTKVEQELTYGM